MKDIIRELLTSKGITAYRLSLDMGMHEGYVSKMLGGQKEISFNTFSSIVDALGYEAVVSVKEKKQYA